jgi:ABC-type amino acid transport substrate-binding protein
MYFSKSFDLGKTWTKPEVFDFCGVFPRTCKLDCGATLITYGRPGIFVRGTFGKANEWTNRLDIVEPIDRSGLANEVKEKKDQGYHDWDGLCGNSDIIAVDDNTALVFYTDFYYPDEKGVKRKTVLAREVKVIDD